MSPNYTVRDLFSYGGFIAGTAAFMLTTQAWDVARIIRVLCAAGVGLVMGWMAVSLYDRIIAPLDRPTDQFDDDNDEFGPQSDRDY